MHKRNLSAITGLFIVITLFIAVFISGCGGGGGGTGSSSGTPETPTENETYTGYLYAPVNRANGANGINGRAATTDGLCVLQCSSPPSGYEAVTDAVIYPEGDPSDIINPDSSGMFTYTFDKSGRDDAGKRLIIKPQGKFADLAPIRHLILRILANAMVEKLILHPNARKVKVGEAIQLYAKAVTTSGRTVFIPSSLLTWQVDNQNVGAISADGVFSGKSAGTASVTVSIGDHSCTGKVFVIANPTTFTYTGVIKDGSGNPVANAVVMVMGMDIVAITGSDGSFTLPKLPANAELSIIVCYLGQVRYQGVIYLTGNLNLDITIQGSAISPGNVQGMVKNASGQGLGGVLVSIDDWSAVTEADGSYSITGIPAGTPMFNFDKSGYTSVTVYREILAGQTSTLDVVMYTSSSTTTGIINGRVVDNGGSGIPSAEVSYTAKSKSPTRATTTTDGNGFFSFTDVPAGNYTVAATRAGYFDNSADVTVTAGQAVETRIQLSPFQAPHIDSIDPTSAVVGQNVTISGTNFGATQGTSTITFNGTPGTPTNWSDTQIICPVPVGATSGDVVVTVLGAQSNGVNLDVVVRWDKNYGGANGDAPDCVCLAVNEGYLVAGSTSSSSSGDVSGVSKGGSDIWVVKLNKHGDLLWEKNYGGSGNDFGSVILKTNDNCYLIAGQTESSSSGDVSGVNNGGRDFWIIKIDIDGNVLWEKNYGGDAQENLSDAIATSDGGYILAGRTQSSANGDITGVNNGSGDYWVVKLDGSGNIQWERNYGGTDNDSATSIKETSDGGFIIAGATASSSSGDVSGFNYGVGDIWIVKIDSSGNIEWEKNYGGNDSDTADTICQTSDGGFVFFGVTYSLIPGNITGSIYGASDFLVVKLDSSGNIEWENSYGGNMWDTCTHGLITQDNHYIAVGYTQSSESGCINSVSNGIDDFWVIKLDSSGNIVWENLYGGSGLDVCKWIIEAPNGGYVLTGHSASSSSGDFTGINNGPNDFWIIKIDGNGILY